MNDVATISQMRERFVEYFSKFATLTGTEKQGIRDGANIQGFLKGTILLKETEVNKKVFFVLKGCVRQYHMIDGEEKSANFFTEEQWVLSLNSLAQNAPAGFFYDCVEDCILMVATTDEYNPMYQAFPRFEAISRLILEKEFSYQQEIQVSYVTDTAERRYLKLLNLKSDLINRVPQYQIASYIGVKPETLSRIRRRIASRK
jgi:CRP-like cAMP-binding protein